MQRIEALAAPQHLRHGRAGERLKRANGNVYRRLPRAAHGTAHIVEQCTVGFVSDILRYGLVPRRYDIRGKLTRCSHAFLSPVDPPLRPDEPMHGPKRQWNVEISGNY